MQSRTADPFAEHVEFMKALYQQFLKKDEADGVAFAESLLAETQATCSHREAAVKDIIRGEAEANWIPRQRGRKGIEHVSGGG